MLIKALTVLSTLIFFSSHTLAAAPKVIAYIGYSSTNNFWLTIKKGIDDAAKAHNIGIIDLTAKDPDVAKQKESIKNAIAKKVSAIILGPVIDTELVESMSLAQKANIPVVVVDTPIDHEWVKSTIATNNIEAAKLAGEYLAKHVAKTDTVLIIGGSEGHVTGEARRSGVESYLKSANINIKYFPSGWKEEQAFLIAKRELQKDPSIKAVFAAWDPGIMVIRKVVSSLKLKDITLVGFDGLPEALHAIKNNEISATVKQDAYKMGQTSVDNILKVIDNKPVDKKIFIDGILVDKSNVDKYIK